MGSRPVLGHGPDHVLLLYERIAFSDVKDFLRFGTREEEGKRVSYTELREELSILVLRAKNEMAINSVVERQGERYRETVDEYYAFKNEFPESKYLNEAEKIFKDAQKALEKNNYPEEEE